MTESELRSAECREFGPEGNEVVGRLVAEVRRLRGLVKAAERTESTPGHCAWCGIYDGEDQHDADCPAFTPEGAVR